MATRGYNGNIITIINNERGYCMANAGNTFSLYTREDLEDNLDLLLESAVENEYEYVQWYNYWPDDMW